MVQVEVTQAEPVSILPGADTGLLLAGVLAFVVGGLLLRKRLGSPTKARKGSQVAVVR